MLKKSDAIRNVPTLLALEGEIRELERKREARRQQKRLAPSVVVVPPVRPRMQTHEKTVDETWSVRAAAEPNPKRNRELLTAHEITRRGEHELGIRYARLHVPQELSYAISTLQANQAISRGDQDSWLRHLNDYLGHFGAAAVRLETGDTLLDRLSTAPLAAVTGGAMVSVIMPAWNAEQTIRAAAASILKQTWRNLELLIVDDASTDGTWAAVQEIAASDERVKIHRNTTNVGPYVSKNIALSMARGSWITGHDADDWAHPQRLEHHLGAVLTQPSPIRASHTYMARISTSGEFDTFSAIGAFSLDGVTRVSSISTLFEEDLLRKQLGYWDSVRFGADSEMISRTRRILGEEFKGIPQIGMLCLSTELSLTNHLDFGIRTTAGGMSPIRAAYKNAWTKEHETRPVNQLYMPFPISRSPYSEDDRHQVPLSDVLANLSDHPKPEFQKNSAKNTYAIKEANPLSHLKFRPNKIAFIIFENFLDNIIKKSQNRVFNRDFFASQEWPSRPNSTTRLSLVNYDVLRRINEAQDSEIDIHVLSGREVTPEAILLEDYDTIIVNQIASVRSHEWLCDFVDRCQSGNFHHKKNIIFGTEVSFGNELKKGTFSQSQINYIYQECLLLRHTARTDTSLYRSSNALNTQIVEFEIGIDTNVVHYGEFLDRRRFITFVAAPEGRVTKDNAFIDTLADKIKKSDLTKKFEIFVLKPPYSTSEYWNIMQNTAFFVFTSNGETFSYVLNDAKACGAITLFKEHLYYSTVGTSFAVSHYPELSFRYLDADDALQIMTDIASSPERMAELSAKSREEAVRLFGIEQIQANWKKLLNREPFETETLLLLAPEIALDEKGVADLCVVHSANYAMSLYNMIDIPQKPVLTHKLGNGSIWLRHFITRSDGQDRYSLGPNSDGNIRYSRSGKRYSYDLDLEIGFYELVRRSYRIGKVVVVAKDAAAVPEALKQVIESRGMGLSVMLAETHHS